MRRVDRRAYRRHLGGRLLRRRDPHIARKGRLDAQRRRTQYHRDDRANLVQRRRSHVPGTAQMSAHRRQKPGRNHPNHRARSGEHDERSVPSAAGGQPQPERHARDRRDGK